jgi:hypothetical protein
LLPRLLVNAFLNEYKIDSSLFTEAQREFFAKQVAVLFDVNPVVARIRLDLLFPSQGITA